MMYAGLMERTVSIDILSTRIGVASEQIFWKLQIVAAHSMEFPLLLVLVGPFGKDNPTRKPDTIIGFFTAGTSRSLTDDGALAVLCRQHQRSATLVIPRVNLRPSYSEQVTVSNHATYGSNMKGRSSLSIFGVQGLHPKKLKYRFEESNSVKMTSEEETAIFR